MKDATKEKALSLLEAAALLFLAYPVGIVVGLLLLGGTLLGRIKILNKSRMPSRENLQKTILVSNHPAVIDPFLIAYLLFKYYAFSPLKHTPLIVADRLNFYEKWWFWPLRSIMVPVDRDDRRKKALALLKIKKAIDKGRIIIIFPEGGRTFKGKEGKFLYGKSGSKIRFLEQGVGLLVRKTGATVLPIGILNSDKVVPNSKFKLWTRFIFWEKITINIGNPISFPQETEREQVTQELAATLLELIDEASKATAKV